MFGNQSPGYQTISPTTKSPSRSRLATQTQSTHPRLNDILYDNPCQPVECYVMPMVLDLLTIFQYAQATQLVASCLAAS